ncbi:MAG: isochorismate synthase MenF [Candidatus Dormibacteria bacterium]
MSQSSAAGASARDAFDWYVPRSGFVMTHRGQGVVVDGPATALLSVAPGPDQVTRAAATARDALAAAAEHSVIVGALPFDGTPVAFLQVAGPLVHVDAAAARDDIDVPAFRVLHTAHEPDEAAYEDAVAEVLRSIDAGAAEKVVLARTLVIESDTTLDPALIASRLAAADPDCHVFAAALPGGAHALVGASPEMLVRRRGDRVASDPLAGSAARSQDGSEDRDRADALLRSVKDRREHRLVAEAVAETLAPYCTALDVAAQPSLLATATLWHLHTAIRGRLHADAPDALSLAAALHPTPAVCGTPRDAALARIRELEPFDRRFYAGIVGWVDASGDGEWVIALRCAEVSGRTARLYAGAGIVAGSEPEAEDRETDVKFEAMLRALGADQSAR